MSGDVIPLRPRPAGRIAPPSLRPAPTEAPRACDLARLLERLPLPENDQ